MSLGLELLPVANYKQDFSHDVLKMDDDNELFELIKELSDAKGWDIPMGGINCYLARDKEDERTVYDNVTEDEYGDRLRCVKASQLSKVFEDNPDKVGYKNTAIAAFVKALPDTFLIYLFWS